MNFNLIAIIIIAVIVFLSAVIPHFITIVIGLVVVLHIIINGLPKRDTTLLDEFFAGEDRIAKKKQDLELSLFKHSKSLYLKSKEWKEKRKKVLQRDNYRCKKCGSKTNLHIHHISYKNIGKEPLDDLVTLCDNCHKKLHDSIGYPKSYDDYMNKDYYIWYDAYDL